MKDSLLEVHKHHLTLCQVATDAGTDAGIWLCVIFSAIVSCGCQLADNLGRSQDGEMQVKCFGIGWYQQETKQNVIYAERVSYMKFEKHLHLFFSIEELHMSDIETGC